MYASRTSARSWAYERSVEWISCSRCARLDVGVGSGFSAVELVELTNGWELDRACAWAADRSAEEAVAMGRVMVGEAARLRLCLIVSSDGSDKASSGISSSDENAGQDGERGPRLGAEGNGCELTWLANGRAVADTDPPGPPGDRYVLVRGRSWLDESESDRSSVYIVVTCETTRGDQSARSVDKQIQGKRRIELTAASLRFCFILSDPGLLVTLAGLDLGRTSPSNIELVNEDGSGSVVSLRGRLVERCSSSSSSQTSGAPDSLGSNAD